MVRWLLTRNLGYFGARVRYAATAAIYQARLRRRQAARTVCCVIIVAWLLFAAISGWISVDEPDDDLPGTEMSHGTVEGTGVLQRLGSDIIGTLLLRPGEGLERVFRRVARLSLPEHHRAWIVVNQREDPIDPAQVAALIWLHRVERLTFIVDDDSVHVFGTGGDDSHHSDVSDASTLRRPVGGHSLVCLAAQDAVNRILLRHPPDPFDAATRPPLAAAAAPLPLANVHVRCAPPTMSLDDRLRYFVVHDRQQANSRESAPVPDTDEPHAVASLSTRDAAALAVVVLGSRYVPTAASFVHALVSGLFLDGAAVTTCTTLSMHVTLVKRPLADLASAAAAVSPSSDVGGGAGAGRVRGSPSLEHHPNHRHDDDGVNETHQALMVPRVLDRGYDVGDGNSLLGASGPYVMYRRQLGASAFDRRIGITEHVVAASPNCLTMRASTLTITLRTFQALGLRRECNVRDLAEDWLKWASLAAFTKKTIDESAEPRRAMLAHVTGRLLSYATEHWARLTPSIRGTSSFQPSDHRRRGEATAAMTLRALLLRSLGGLQSSGVNGGDAGKATSSIGAAGAKSEAKGQQLHGGGNSETPIEQIETLWRRVVELDDQLERCVPWEVNNEGVLRLPSADAVFAWDASLLQHALRRSVLVVGGAVLTASRPFGSGSIAAPRGGRRSRALVVVPSVMDSVGEGHLGDGGPSSPHAATNPSALRALAAAVAGTANDNSLRSASSTTQTIGGRGGSPQVTVAGDEPSDAGRSADQTKILPSSKEAAGDAPDGTQLELHLALTDDSAPWTLPVATYAIEGRFFRRWASKRYIEEAVLKVVTHVTAGWPEEVLDAVGSRLRSRSETGRSSLPDDVSNPSRAVENATGAYLSGELVDRLKRLGRHRPRGTAAIRQVVRLADRIHSIETADTSVIRFANTRRTVLKDMQRAMDAQSDRVPPALPGGTAGAWVKLARELASLPDVGATLDLAFPRSREHLPSMETANGEFTKPTQFRHPDVPLVVVWDAMCCHCCGFLSEIAQFIVSLSQHVSVRTFMDESCYCGGYNGEHADVLRRLVITPLEYAAIPSTYVVVWVSHRQPDLYRSNPAYGYRTPDYFIGRSMYEFTKIPSSWPRAMQDVPNEVWVPSQWQADIFREQGVPAAKLTVMPEPIDVNAYDPARYLPMEGREIDQLPEQRCLFGKHPRRPPSSVPKNKVNKGQTTTTRFLSHFKWEPRKGWTFLLQAYFDAFAPPPRNATTDASLKSGRIRPLVEEAGGADVELVILTSNPFVPQAHAHDSVLPLRDVELFMQEHYDVIGASYETISSGAAGRSRNRTTSPGPPRPGLRTMRLADMPPVCIIASPLSEDDMKRLYMAADAFVLPTRGEGWGLPLMQAMALAVPTIGTAFGGQTTFMTPETSVLLQVERMEEVPEKNVYGYEHGKRWAVPSVTQLVRILRLVRQGHGRSEGEPPDVETHGKGGGPRSTSSNDQGNVAIGRALGQRARKHIVAHFSGDAIVALVLGRLSEIHNFVLDMRRQRPAPL
mgnify:CR=1 FL=1